MAQNRCLLVALIAIVMAVSVQQAFGLKCWHCDSVQYPECTDPFAGKNDTNEWYKECPPVNVAPGQPSTNPPACVKAKTPNGHIIRTCANNGENTKAACNVDSETAEVCESCSDRDGCNGASLNGPVMMTLAIPMIIFIKISTF